MAESTISGPAITCSQKLLDDEWSTPEWEICIDKFMEVLNEKLRMEQMDYDAPSFSLGLTHDPLFNRDMNTTNDTVRPIIHKTMHFDLS